MAKSSSKISKNPIKLKRWDPINTRLHDMLALPFPGDWGDWRTLKNTIESYYGHLPSDKSNLLLSVSLLGVLYSVKNDRLFKEYAKDKIISSDDVFWINKTISQIEKHYKIHDDQKNKNSMFELWNHIRHYLDLISNTNTQNRYREIRDMNWDGPVNDTLSKFIDIERRIADEELGVVEKREDAILKYHDGHQWEWIKSDQCSDEGEAAGHCATVEGWMRGEHGNMFSLRSEKGKVLLTASAFNIFLNEGRKDKITEDSAFVVGQIRGPHNSKPKDEVIPYIVDLLSQKFVKHHIPDSYRERDQFLIRGLTPLVKTELFSANKCLENFKAWEKNDKKSFLYFVVYNTSANHNLNFLEHKKEWFIDLGDWSMRKFLDNRYELIDVHNTEEYRHLFKLLDDGEMNYDWHGFDTSDLLSYLDDLSEKTLKAFMKLFEVKEPHDLLEKEEFRNDFNHALNMSIEQGVNDQYWSMLKSYIDNALEENGLKIVEVEDDEKLVVTLSKMAENMDDHLEITEYGHMITIELPKKMSGHELDYDTSNAEEFLLDEYHKAFEELAKKNKK